MTFCTKVLMLIFIYLQNEYMIGTISANPPVSRLTLALFEDSGLAISLCSEITTSQYIITDGIGQIMRQLNLLLGEFRVVAGSFVEVAWNILIIEVAGNALCTRNRFFFGRGIIDNLVHEITTHELIR